MTRAELIAKIKALFRLGDRSRNQSEGEILAATAAARRLMARYDVSEAEVKDSAETEKAIPWEWSIKHAADKDRGEIPPWQCELAHVVEVLASVKLLVKCSYRKPDAPRSLCFAGSVADVEIAVELWKSLSDSIRRRAYKLFVPTPEPGTYLFTTQRKRKGRWSVEHDSYAMGFCFTLKERARQSVDLSPAEASAYAIVVGNKRDWIKAQIRERFPDMPTLDEKSLELDAQAFTAGMNDGHSMDLGFKRHLAEGA